MLAERGKSVLKSLQRAHRVSHVHKYRVDILFMRFRMTQLYLVFGPTEGRLFAPYVFAHPLSSTARNSMIYPCKCPNCTLSLMRTVH